jgi:BirA family transcriptional regulator, biotin operon repressor / biotin---[acetyl-CoA-carboxylase] ligase
LTTDSFPLLSSADIQSAMDNDSLNKLDDILIHSSVNSTNDALWQRLASGKSTPAVCLSESQTAGRGRRGDHWHSPSAGNLYLSLFWPFPANMTKNGLSIAIGISVINTLKAEGINDLQLKWPNDILHKRHKLGGILVESRFGQQQHTVVGIGLNFKLPTKIQTQINQKTTSLQQLCTEVPCRNQLAGKLIQNMIKTIELFQHRGLSDFIPLWPQYDALDNQVISMINNDSQITALACGINEQGELRYMHNNKLQTLSNSHVSIRFAS